jgi:hypothetical protein
MGKRRGAYRLLVWRPEGRRPLRRPRHRREDNIKMDIREVGWGSLVYTVMNLWVL